MNGKVKGRFQPYFDLLMTVGEGMITEQFMEFFNMEDMDSKPQHRDFDDLSHQPKDQQKSFLLDIIQKFMKYFGYGLLETPHLIPRRNEYQERVEKRSTILVNGQQFIIQTSEEKTCYKEEDEVSITACFYVTGTCMLLKCMTLLKREISTEQYLTASMPSHFFILILN